MTFGYTLRVWTSTLVTGALYLTVYMAYTDDEPVLPALPGYLTIAGCLLCITVLFSLPLLVAFGLAVNAVSQSRARPATQKSLLCLALLLLYIPFFLILRSIAPTLLDLQLQLLLHGYLLTAFVFTWVYRLPDSGMRIEY